MFGLPSNGVPEELLDPRLEPCGASWLHACQLARRADSSSDALDAVRLRPYSGDFLQNVANALSLPAGSYPELVKPMQERIGCLMYAATSTRPDKGTLS